MARGDDIAENVPSKDSTLLGEHGSGDDVPDWVVSHAVATVPAPPPSVSPRSWMVLTSLSEPTALHPLLLLPTRGKESRLKVGEPLSMALRPVVDTMDSCRPTLVGVPASLRFKCTPSATPSSKRKDAFGLLVEPWGSGDSGTTSPVAVPNDGQSTTTFETRSHTTNRSRRKLPPAARPTAMPITSPKHHPRDVHTVNQPSSLANVAGTGEWDSDTDWSTMLSVAPEVSA